MALHTDNRCSILVCLLLACLQLSTVSGDCKWNAPFCDTPTSSFYAQSSVAAVIGGECLGCTSGPTNGYYQGGANCRCTVPCPGPGHWTGVMCDVERSQLRRLRHWLGAGWDLQHLRIKFRASWQLHCMHRSLGSCGGLRHLQHWVGRRFMLHLRSGVDRRQLQHLRCPLHARRRL
ncbi:hypothetical protein WJX72_005884 [[Myrmecia] bisecta]|uniref:Uncharacterized protein n=1 Tax=[Myrmecia] bisecta TaxID=41462 RepID=A0AAW1Q401_9CHLO